MQLLLLTWMLLSGRAEGIPGAQDPQWTSRMGQGVLLQWQHFCSSVRLRRLLGGEGAWHCARIPGEVPLGDLCV